MKSKKSKPYDKLQFKALGKGKTAAARKLEAFPNLNPERDYTVELTTDEFTCLCPMTGQPDFARITIRYTPDKRVVESKSLKLYLWSYREEGAFHEHITNRILDDLVKLIEPRRCEVIGEFAVRGGIGIKVTAVHPTPSA